MFGSPWATAMTHSSCTAFTPSYICAVWWPKANKAGALASMLTGAVVSLGLDAATGWGAMVAGIGSSTLAMVVGNAGDAAALPSASSHSGSTAGDLKKGGPKAALVS